jgi:tetratricopeptide (TPR) repeat protein
MKNIKAIKKLKKIQEIMLNNPKEAMEIFKTIKIKDIDLEDSYELAMVGADIFYYGNQFDRAIQYYRKALEIPIKNKNEAKCYYNIADCYFEKDNYKLAVENYEKVLSIKSKVDRRTLGKTYFGLGITYLITEEYNKALEYFQKVLKLYCKRPKAGFEKDLYEDSISSHATCYWKLGNIEKSEEYFNKIIKIPNITPWILAKTYAIKAHRLFENKDWENAIEHYKKAISLTDSEENKKDWQECIELCEKELK